MRWKKICHAGLIRPHDNFPHIRNICFPSILHIRDIIQYISKRELILRKTFGLYFTKFHFITFKYFKFILLYVCNYLRECQYRRNDLNI